MYNVYVEKDGERLLHTFNLAPIGRSFADPIDLYRQQIATVQGYAVDPAELVPRSMTSLPVAEWIDKMIEDHREDVIDAAQQFAAASGISLSHSTTATEKKEKTPRRKTQPVEPKEAPEPEVDPDTE